MRITGGIATGRRLHVPAGHAVRPTPDLVKQAVFNRLGPAVIGASVLELFAGSGALGLECLSRGAAHVVALELIPRHAAVIRRNLSDTGLPEAQYELRLQDVFKALASLRQSGRTFRLILADPPFGEKNVGRRSESMSQALLDDTDLPALLDPDGLFVLGHSKRDTLTLPRDWQDTKTLRHGDSLIRFLRHTHAV
jgi:16S rRNA (guanine966-N2)-methyltransferase